MQLPISCCSRLLRTCRSGFLLLALAALGAACDRHDATEAPESYGHGSTHKPDYTSHQIDSRQHSNHFSDTRGVNEASPDVSVPASAATPTAGEKPTATPDPLGIGR